MTRLAILLPDLRGGGAERVAVNLANGFARRGYTVDVVLMEAAGELLGELHPKVRIVDLKVGRIRSLVWPLVRYLRHARPGALLASMWPLTVIAVVSRRLSGTRPRLVVSEHTTWSHAELLERPTVGWQVRNSMRLLFPRADGIVCVSQGAADDLARFTGLQRPTISAIYNPVTGDAPTRIDGPHAPLAWWAGEHKRILAVGRLKGEKDYPTLLRALALLTERVDARLLVLGEGECRAELEALVRSLGLQDRVFLHGFVQDPAPYFNRADLHVLSSVAEGFGNVIVEALAAGTPVVSTDCPSGPREILKDGEFGRLVPVGDAAAMATAMHTALITPPDRLALMARANVFSIDAAVEGYQSLLFPQRAPAQALP